MKTPKDKTDKGKKGGSCNRTACQRPGADYYNKYMDAFYCLHCAQEITLYARKMGDPIGFDVKEVLPDA